MTRKKNSSLKSKKDIISSPEQLQIELNKRLSSLIGLYKGMYPNLGGIHIYLDKATNNWISLPLLFELKENKENF